MRNPNEAQLANLALQLLGRSTLQMAELDAAAAVRDWLVSLTRPVQPEIQMQPHLNGAGNHDQPVGE